MTIDYAKAKRALYGKRPRPGAKHRARRVVPSRPALPRHERKHISLDELRLLLAEAKKDVFDHALILCMYNLALRASEVGLLQLGHVAHLHDRGIIYTPRVKGSKPDWLEVQHQTAQAVVAWVAYCYPDKKARKAEDRLFPGDRYRGRAKGLSRWSVARAIRRLCKRAGLPDEVAHPHTLRHGRVMHILEKAAKTPSFAWQTLIPTLAKFLGHAKAMTTVTYYMNRLQGALSVEADVMADLFDGPEDGSVDWEDR